jgi:hypothetical protein
MSEIVLRLDPAAVPVWAWITAGVVLWYAVAAVVLRIGRKTVFPILDENDAAPAWVFSPLWLPIFAVVMTVWVVLLRPVGRFISGGRS